MQEMLNGLKIVLNEEYEIYCKLFEAAKRKTDVIMQGNIKELEQITKFEETNIYTIIQLENKREILAESISKEVGIREESNISQIIAKLSGKDKKEIDEIKEKLHNVLTEMKRVNDLNNTLITDNLDFINLNINLLTNTRQNNVYGKGESNFIQQNNNIFDIKA